ncbi:MAG TPA: hypothetical protein P5266_03015, partial [Candidatus Fermentibacter sp.]|nr:hypothetical protein [Candidatus Fermentibacter sp.]
MKLWPIVLVPFALASGSGESYQWQSLGGEAGDMPRFEMVESDLGHFVADVSFPGFWITSFPGGGQRLIPPPDGSLLHRAQSLKVNAAPRARRGGVFDVSTTVGALV